MSKKEIRNVRTGPEKYVRRVRCIFMIAAVAVFFALMILLALAVGLSGTPRIVYGCSAGALLLLFLVGYGSYEMGVSMGTVLSVEITEQVVHLTTRRKVFTYDVKRGCVGVKRTHNRFVCTFETQNSRDKFSFYTHAPLSAYGDSQFSEEDIRAFCPRYDELLEL